MQDPNVRPDLEGFKAVLVEMRLHVGPKLDD